MGFYKGTKEVFIKLLCQQEFWGSVKNSIKNIVALWGLVQDIVTALYTRLCFLLMVEFPPSRLLHSWNHPFHNFHCRNDTIEVYLDLFSVSNVFHFCKLNFFINIYLVCLIQRIVWKLSCSLESTFSWLSKTVGVVIKRRACHFLACVLVAVFTF